MSNPRTGICRKCARTTFPWNARGDLRCDFCDKPRDLYGETIDRLEPNITAIDAGAFYASTTISLKRIADTLDWFKQCEINKAKAPWINPNLQVPVPPGPPIDPFSDQRS